MSNDISIQQAGSSVANVQIRSGPTYLISLSQGTVSPYFIATKVDEQANVLKAVGLFVRGIRSSDLVIKDYSKLLSSAKLEEMVDISFPWHQVCSIQNLIYRHKGK